jgi:hypothetical protein
MTDYTRHIPTSETTIYYPKSKRKVVIDHTGRVISDSNKDSGERINPQ